MAKKKRSTTRGARGRTGKTGKTGPAGPAGSDHANQIKSLATQVDAFAKDLRTQLIRIAQIQAQLDRLATGLGPDPRNRRSSGQPEH